ncbi:phage major capsid protein [Poseidonibacter lekithochrous]|uniref:phage major capsid protein n=1 Tax=Poseidonibacter lekithochrous TaxID=1904463 RepID=UPI0013DB29DB|nr:phage major capsid protein [Poseidonibacter lekithochrous]
MPKKEFDNKPQYREFEVRGIDEEKRTVELSFSSEDPYKRWWGIEILDHSTKSVDMSRLNNAAPALFNHKWDVVVGVIESATIEKSRGKATVRFSKNAKADEVFRDVVDGILTKVSVGYQILERKLESEQDGVETYRVTKWQPFEISIVSIPADDTVGVGRSAEPQGEEVKNLNQDEKDEKMPKKEDETITSVDVEAAKKEARTAERSRVRDITAIGAKHGMDGAATEAIEKGTSIENFRTLVLDKLGEPAAPIDTKSNVAAEIGMNNQEVKNYSFARALRALANPNDKRAQDEAAFEYEMSSEAQRASGIAAQGILVPFDVFNKDLTVGGTGGVTVDTQMGGLIEILRNKSAVMKLAEILPGLTGNLSFPKQTGSTTADQYGETDAITASDIALGELVMSPKRYGGQSNYSKQMLHQSSVAIENLIRNDLMNQIGLKIDLDAVMKILNETGIGLVDIDTNGGVITNSHIVDLETEVAVDNADMGRLAYLMNARTRGFLKKTPVTAGNPKMILNGNDLNGYGYQVSNQIPANLTKGTGTDLSALIYGNFADLLVGLWGGIDLTVDPYTKELREKGLIGIQAEQFADIGVRRSESFAAIKDGKVQ